MFDVMRPPSSLPLEIYQAIVDYVPAQKTLYTLLFTSRMLKTCAERALLRHIDMGPNRKVPRNGPSPLQLQLEHIRRNPRLACCVRSLSFFPVSRSGETLNEVMVDILPLMINLEHFRLTAFHPLINEHSHHLHLKTLDVIPHINAGIASFITSQPAIQELTIFSLQGVVTNITPGMLPNLHTVCCPGNEDLCVLLRGRKVTRVHSFLGGFPLISIDYEDRIKIHSLFVHFITGTDWGSLLNLRYLRIYYVRFNLSIMPSQTF